MKNYIHLAPHLIFMSGSKNNIIPLEERDLVKDEEYFCIIVTNEKRIKGIKAKWNGNKFNFSNVGKVDIVIPIKDFNF